MACFGYYGSLNFYNAFLLQIATPTTIGRISGWGNALGFLGGGLILTVNLVMVKPSLLGFSWPPFTVPEVTVSVAFWMLVFALPVLIWLRERTIPCSLPPGERLLLFGFRRAWETLRQLKHYRQLSRYFLAYLVFNDGISTAMFMASIFGAQVLGMKPDELILYFLATQATGLVGSLLFGYWGDRIGQRRALMVTLVLWSLIVLWAFQLGIGGNPKAEFWVIGLLAGIALGGNLVVSRSLAGALMPAEKAAEFFGFLGVAGRFAAVLGPLVYGISIELTGSLQKSILSLLVFFLLGMLLLLRVNEREGTREREFHFR
jgi:UMF1 family MFS transporter